MTPHLHKNHMLGNPKSHLKCDVYVAHQNGDKHHEFTHAYSFWMNACSQRKEPIEVAFSDLANNKLPTIFGMKDYTTFLSCTFQQ